MNGLRVGFLLSGMGNATLAVLALAGWRSDLLDSLSHFALVWLAAGVVVAVAGWVLGGRLGKTGAALGLIGAAAAGALLTPEWLLARADAPVPRGEGPVLKIVQFNLWGRNPEPRRTLDWILAQGADVVVAEEAFGAALPISEGLRAAYPYWSSCDLPRPCSVMVYSRLPMLERGSRQGPPSAWARYAWQGRVITVVGAHYYWPYPAGMQQWQGRRMAAWLSGQPKVNLILAGDFNATPWSASLRRQDRAFGLQRRTHGLRSWPARPFSRFNLPAPLPILPIDQVYAGAGWRTVSVRRGPRLGSDHYPVVVELTPR